MQTLIIDNYKKIVSSLPKNVILVAVSKNHPAHSIQTLYDLGHRIFGENKVQELVDKYEELPKDIKWQLIGHLQTNKVKYIAPFIDTIESVDSNKLLEEISKQAVKNDRNIKVLLQVKIAQEESKFGFTEKESRAAYEEWLSGKYPSIEIIGLMGMATFTDDQNQLVQEFSKLKSLFDELSQIKPLKTLSMGMSDDYTTAISCGSNSVRIGSAIFGSRQYL